MDGPQQPPSPLGSGPSCSERLQPLCCSGEGATSARAPRGVLGQRTARQLHTSPSSGRVLPATLLSGRGHLKFASASPVASNGRVLAHSGAGAGLGSNLNHLGAARDLVSIPLPVTQKPRTCSKERQLRLRTPMRWLTGLRLRASGGGVGRPEPGRLSPLPPCCADPLPGPRQGWGSSITESMVL